MDSLFQGYYLLASRKHVVTCEQSVVIKEKQKANLTLEDEELPVLGCQSSQWTVHMYWDIFFRVFHLQLFV